MRARLSLGAANLAPSSLRAANSSLRAANSSAPSPCARSLSRALCSGAPYARARLLPTRGRSAAALSALGAAAALLWARLAALLWARSLGAAGCSALGAVSGRAAPAAALLSGRAAAALCSALLLLIPWFADRAASQRIVCVKCQDSRLQRVATSDNRQPNVFSK